MLIVDSHSHVFLKDMPHVANPRHRIQYDFTVEMYLRTLDEHGVQFAVLSAASPYGDYNDYTIASIRGRPRLRGTVILSPNVDRYILEMMARDGIIGVRLPYISLAELPDLTTFEYQRFLRRLRDLDWHAHLHLDGPRLPQVLPALERSGVKLVIDHFGRPDPRHGINCEGFQMMLRTLENGRTWVKVSAGYRLGPAKAEQYGRELLRQSGAEHLLWGSDCPFVGHESEVAYQQTIDAVLAWLPDEATRRKVLGENAMRFFFS
jgi:predicted TIM-barrel fold metal-dependent hydrolase